MQRFRARLVTLVILILIFMTTATYAATKVTIMTHYSPGFPHGDALAQYVKEYESLNPGIEIENVFAVVDGYPMFR